MAMSVANKARLSNGIVISLESECNRKDLEFVSYSKIDDKPIYLYTGYDFKSFDLPYEEIVSSTNYSSHVDKRNKLSDVNDEVIKLRKKRIIPEVDLLEW
jgi:hypothetical protein